MAHHAYLRSPARYAVIGNPIDHSKSPRIHALFAAQSGQEMRYDALLAPLDGFAAAVAGFAAAGGRGANVTVPFKEEAFRLASRLSARAQAAGAVNLLSFVPEGILGDNTDGAGLVRDLAVNLGFAVAERRLLLVGAGGAARGVIMPLLAEKPATLRLANRDAGRARRLAADFPGCTGGSFADLTGQSFDLVINATSAGLSGAELPLSADVFAAHGLAYEMVYGCDTPFLRQARATGIATADGLGMLVEQAAEAFFIWRHVRPDTAPVLAALRQG
jgi:shikimate dehydrogenase